MTLATERLVLTPVTAADHARLHALFTQPGVRRTIFDDQIISPEQTSEIIHKSEELFRTERYGLWTAWLKPGPAMLIGFGALWYFRDPPELELLYGIGDDYVKNGFGREIARAIVDYGFNTLGMSTVRASTDPAHVDSRRLLDDLGFTFERQAIVGDLDTVFYVRHRE